MATAPELIDDGIANAFSGQAIPYLAVYDLEETADTPKLNDFKGLLFLHRVTSPGLQDRLVTYWLSRDHWAAAAQRLSKTPATPPILEGLAHSIEVGAKPFWRRLHLYTWALAFAALLGALDAIGNHYSWLFAQPQVSIELKEARSIDTVAGGPFAATVRVSNRTSTEHREILITSAVLKPRDNGSPTRVTRSLSRIAALTPGSSVDIELTGKAPTSGLYDLQVTLTGKAGLLVPKSEFSFTHSLRSWPSKPEVKWKLEAFGPNHARISATLSLGYDAAHGVDCQVYIYPRRSRDRPILDFFESSDEEWISDNNTSGRERELFQWHGLATRGEKAFYFTIPIEGGEDLNALRTKISINCTKSTKTQGEKR